MRLRYAAHRMALVEALQRHAPKVELRRLAAGFHTVAQLPIGTDERATVTAAHHQSVGRYGMSTYRIDLHPWPTRLVLGFGNLTADANSDGIATVADPLQRS